jgi:hypothetical protein
MRSPRAAIGLLAALDAVSLTVMLAGCGGPSGSAGYRGTAGSSSGLTSDAALPTQVPTGTTLVIADQAEYQLLDQPRAHRDPHSSPIGRPCWPPSVSDNVRRERLSRDHIARL